MANADARVATGEIPPSSSRRRRSIPNTLVAVLVVVAVLAALAALRSSATPRLAAGPGTATINWNSGKPGGANRQSQSFSGTIDGMPVAGTTTGPGPSSVSQAPSSAGASFAFPSAVQVATWTGTATGVRFHLSVTMSLPPQLRSLRLPTGLGPSLYDVNPSRPQVRFLPGQKLAISIGVTGSFGTQPINVKAEPLGLSKASGEIRFTGTIGKMKIHGVVRAPYKNGQTETFQAWFTALG